MKVRGVLRPGVKRIAKIKIRIMVNGIPRDAEVRITDIMFQPGGSVSGWLPHVTELPWSAGITP